MEREAGAGSSVAGDVSDTVIGSGRVDYNDYRRELSLAFQCDCAYLRVHPDIVMQRSGWRRKGPAPNPHCFTGGPQEFQVTDIARIIEIVEPEAKALGF